MQGEYKLTDDEVMLLDGRVSDLVQKAIEGIKQKRLLVASEPDLSPSESAFIISALTEAKTNLMLQFTWTQLSGCKVCGKRAGYAKKQRAGKYHRKGDTDWSKPLYFLGVELARRFVSVRGCAAVGCCGECWEKIKPYLAKALIGVEAQIAETITGHKPLYRRHDNRHCTQCDWRGHEGEMGRMKTLFGDGTYPGICPSCGSKNNPLGRNIIETDDGHVVVRTEEPINQPPCDETEKEAGK